MKTFFLFISTLLLLSISVNAELNYYHNPDQDNIDFLHRENITRGRDFKDTFSKELEIFKALSVPDMKPFSQSVIKFLIENNLDILLGKGRQLSEKMNPSDTMVFLGRTPFVFSLIMKALAKNHGKNTLNLVDVGFSGTPDSRSTRTEGYSTQKNLVTTENLQFYENFLTSKGFDQVDGTVYIVDGINTGGSLNSFLRILIHYYTINLKKKLPNIVFVALNISDDKNIYSVKYIDEESALRVNVLEKSKFDDRKKNIAWHFGPGSRKLAFSKREELGWKQMTVDTIPLNIPHELLKYFDWEPIQYLLSPTAYFPAYMWSKECMPLKTAAQQEGVHQFAGFLDEILTISFAKNITLLTALKKHRNYGQIIDLNKAF